MLRNVSAVMAALALCTGVAYAEEDSKVEPAPEAREKGAATDTKDTATPAKPVPAGDTRDKGGVTDTKEGSAPTNPGTQATAVPAKEPLDLPELFARLHTLNQREIRLGNLASKKARKRSVKAYGRMLSRDHKKSDRELAKLARKMKIKIGKFEPKVDGDREAVNANAEAEQRLKGARGASFDAMFLTEMVKDHAQAIELLTSFAERPTEPAVKELLEKTLSALKKHREAAESLLGKNKAAS